MEQTAPSRLVEVTPVGPSISFRVERMFAGRSSPQRPQSSPPPLSPSSLVIQASNTAPSSSTSGLRPQAQGSSSAVAVPEGMRPSADVQSGGVKKPRRSGLQTTEEVEMRLITAIELQSRDERSLSDLFGKVSQRLAATRTGTPERRNALATLENISRARALRLAQSRGGV